MSSSFRYLPALDGYRGIAVLMVMLYHAKVPYFTGGLLGVDLFFVLSGFLITSLLLDEYRAQGTISFKNFYMRRVLRLAPALLLTIGMVWALDKLYLKDAFTDWRMTSAALFFYANWISAFKIHSMGLLTHFWTLAIEEQFYLVWPLTLLFLLRRNMRPGAMMFLLTLVIGLMTANVFRLVSLGHTNARALWATDTRAVGLLVGAILALMRASNPTLDRSAIVWIWLAGISGWLLFAFMNSVSDRVNYLLIAQGGILVTALSGAGIIMHLALIEKSWIHRMLQWQPLVYTGKISYGLYLFHSPIVLAANAHLRHLPLWERTIVSLGLSYAVATASFYLVEKSALRLKSRYTTRHVGQTPVQRVHP